MPQFLSRLRNLEELYLHNNKFVGTVPDDLDAGEKLYALDLSGNKLEGYVPNMGPGHYEEAKHLMHTDNEDNETMSNFLDELEASSSNGADREL